jgi:flagellar motor switch protein FliG
MAEEDLGAIRGAILLTSIGEELAARVLQNLQPRYVQRLGTAIASLGTTTPEELHEAVEKLKLEVRGKISLTDSGDDYLRSVLERALGPERAQSILDRILVGADQSGIDAIKWMDPASIAELIKNEHPQIIAVILAHLDYDAAADVVKLFTERLRNDVMLRIATMEGIQPNALRELNEALSRLLSGSDRMMKSNLGGVKTTAEIMNFMGALEGPTLDSMREVDFDLAQAIQDQMFVFENLLELDDRSVQNLLREVQSDSLILALKGTSEPLKEKIFRNMSQRAAEMLREDLEARGPVKLSEVEAEQKEIIKVVRQLVEDGTIVLAGKGEEGLVA